MASDLKTKNRREHYASTNDNYQCNYQKLKAHKKYQYLECDRQTDRHVKQLK